MFDKKLLILRQLSSIALIVTLFACQSPSPEAPPSDDSTGDADADTDGERNG